MSPRAETPGRTPPWVCIVITTLAVLAFFGGLWSQPFRTDDFIFLAKTRDASFSALWSTADLLEGYYRPWSRELHFWALQRLGGANVHLFHGVNLALWACALALYGYLVRAMSGTRIACVAVAGMAALSASSVPLIWAAGAQDLWMLVFAMAFLVAHVKRNVPLASVSYALALLSKESAVALPLVAIAYDVVVAREGARNALRRSAGFVALTVVWALLHPSLGGRLLYDYARHPQEVESPPALARGIAALLGLVNLDVVPAPDGGWWKAIGRGIVGVVLLVALVLWGARARWRASGRQLALGLIWAIACWGVLLVPDLTWRPYYGLLGAFGAWLGLATLLSRWTVLACIVVAAVGILRPVRDATPQLELGSPWYQRGIGRLTRLAQEDMMRQQPVLPHDARVFLVRMPGGLSLITGPGKFPALRTWYDDSSLRGDFASRYSPREAVDSSGRDFFFFGNEVGRWTQARLGPESPAKALGRDPTWQSNHRELARLLREKGNPAAALEEYLKLAEADPGRFEHLYGVALCHRDLGDTLLAIEWIKKAGRAPDAPDDLKRRVASGVNGR